jgi:hypothetical protein
MSNQLLQLSINMAGNSGFFSVSWRHNALINGQLSGSCANQLSAQLAKAWRCGWRGSAWLEIMAAIMAWRINGVMAAEENIVMKAYLGENVAKYLAKIST